MKINSKVFGLSRGIALPFDFELLCDGVALLAHEVGAEDFFRQRVFHRAFFAEVFVIGALHHVS